MKVDLNCLLVIPHQCLGHLTWHPWECYCPSHLGHHSHWHCPCRLGQQPHQCCLSCLGRHHQYSPWSPGKQEVKILSHAWNVRACLRLGTCYVLVLMELQRICRMGTQGDKSLLDAWAEMRRKLSSHSARVWLYITGGQHGERSYTRKW